jgi:hypothetical protein
MSFKSAKGPFSSLTIIASMISMGVSGLSAFSVHVAPDVVPDLNEILTGAAAGAAAGAAIYGRIRAKKPLFSKQPYWLIYDKIPP